MDPLWQQINEAIHRRDIRPVPELIRKFLKYHRSSPKAVYEASEFYRKIRDFKSALRILPKESTAVPKHADSDVGIKLELQLARLLNLLGASNYALRVIDRIRAQKRAQSFIEMVEIYYCNGRYQEAVALLGADYPMPHSEPWHQEWLLHIYLSYALAEIGRTDLAISRMQRMRKLSSSPLIRAMALGFEGKYLAASGDPEKALGLLLESKKFYPRDDSIVDYANLLTALGECLLALERYDEAESTLQEGLKLLYRPAVRLEDWLEPALLLERIPNQRKQKPQLALRVRAIFGQDYHLLKLSALRDSTIDGQFFSVSGLESSRKSRHLDRASDTAWKAGKARLGLDLVDALIFNLIYAGKYGLPQFCLYDLLWPDEPFSFDQHQKRLEYAVGKARARGYKILWKDLHLFLSSNDVTTTGRPGRTIRGRSFLDENPTFLRRDVEKYFSISSASAGYLCKDWVKSGLVLFEKPSRYRVVDV